MMSLPRLKEVIASEWVKCFKEVFCNEAGLSHFKRWNISTADDLVHLPIPEDHRESRQLAARWQIIKAAPSAQAVVACLLDQREACFEGELAPTISCYQLHAWAEVIAKSLKTAIQENLLTPALSEQIERVLKEQQKKQENKKPFAYAKASYETQIFGRVMAVTEVAYSGDVGLFFKPQVTEPFISGQHVSPESIPASAEVSSADSSLSLRSQTEPLDPKNEVKRRVEGFQGKEVFSSEHVFYRTKKAFAQGKRAPSLAEKLIKYSVWKQRKTTDAMSERLRAAKEMAEQIVKVNLANC